MRPPPAPGCDIARIAFEMMVCLLLALLCWPLGSPATQTGLTLKSAVTVDGEAVRLSDVATVSGLSPADMARLGAIVVAQSPPPGQMRFVDVDYIRIRLRQAGVDTDTMAFAGSADVRVKRRSAKLPTVQIKRAIESSIRQRMPWSFQAVTISDIHFDEHIQLPVGKLTYRIDPGRHEDYLGPTAMTLVLYVDGEPLRLVPVRATIAVMADVVAAASPIGKHQHIEADDLTVISRDLATLPSDIVTDLEDALGNRATRMIYPDTVLQTSMIAMPPMVRRGDVVKIVARTGAMTITATGTIREKGCKGDLVRVVNTDSKRVVTARVTGPGAVEVNF